MVVSLELCRIVGETVSIFSSHLSETHHIKLLEALSLNYDHARSFNLEFELQKKLYDRAFMRFGDNLSRPPNLIDQEVQSSSQILVILTRLLDDLDVISIENWIEWY
jgi:hypothetical protein